MNIREQAQEIAALIDKRNGQGIKADEYVRLARLRTQTNDDIARVLVRALDVLDTIAAYANVATWPDGYDLSARTVARRATDDAKGFLASLEKEDTANG